MKQSKKLLLLAVFSALAIPLVFAGIASAKYVGDGAVQNATTGGWDLPADKGFCVTGIKSDGTMIFDLSVGNSRPDCLAKIWPAYQTSATCVASDKAGANAEGSHYWTSTCLLGTDNTQAISLSGLDRTRYMCEQKGGTWRQACTSNWTAMGPTWSAAPVASSQGGTDGFCYTTIRLDNYDNTTCPKVVAGSPGTGTFGYAWNTTTNACTYSYGIIGRANAALNYKDGHTPAYAAAGSLVDLSGLTNGQCLANGASFSNHTTKGGNVIEADSLASTIAKPITQVRAGCLSCHNTTTQYNSVKGRWKSDYLKQGHKNMLRKVTPGKLLGGPASDGTFKIYTDWFLEAPADPEESGAPGGESLGTFDWVNGTITSNGIEAPAGTYPLMYIAGAMNEVLEPIIWDNSIKTAILNISEGAYGCAACHVTGYRNDNVTIGVCTKSRYNNNPTACATNSGTYYPMTGVEGLGRGGAEPMASWPAYYTDNGVDYGYGRNIKGITGRWDWDGINCNRCHKVAYDPTLPINDEGVNAPAGFTTHETDIFDGWKCVSTCYGCHQSGPVYTNNNVGGSSAADKDLAHPEAIPVSNSATSPAYKPYPGGHVIGNSFLNSPHGRFTGSVLPNPVGKYDIVPGGTYDTAFVGKLCRSSTTAGGGSILETMANGDFIKTLEDCNRANGKTVGDAGNYGYWQDESGGGSCITCHNVHVSMFLTSEEAKEPLRRECTTCHTDKLINDMRHPLGAGTPDALSGGNAAVACEICHMPEVNGSLPVHLWRINADASYSTFPTAAQFGIGATATKKMANAAPDKGYASAVWLDVDLACGHCHGGGLNSTDNPPKSGLPYYTKATLATFAGGIHQGSITNSPPTAAITGLTQTGFQVSLTDASTDAETSQASLVITVKWGDGAFSTGSGGGTFSHTYATAGTFPIFYTVQDAGGLFNSTTMSVSVPVRYSISGKVFEADLTTGFVGANVYLKQNGITKALQQTVDGTYSFANLTPGTYQVQVYKTGMVFDGDLATPGTQNPISVTVSSADVPNKYFARVAKTITVNTSPALDNVTMYLKQNGVVKASGKTVTGTVAFAVVPGTYQVQASKAGYSFGPANPVTVDATADVATTFTHTP